MQSLSTRRFSAKRRNGISSLKRVRNRLRMELLEDRRLLASDITIGSLEDGNVTRVSDGTTATYTASDDVVEIDVQDIIDDLDAGLNVVVDTASGAAGTGDILVSSAISQAGVDATHLTLLAENSITVDTAIDSSGGPLSITLNADSDGNLAGNVTITENGDILTNNGDLVIGGGQDPSTDPAYGVDSLDSGVNIAGVVLTGSGNISIVGQGGFGNVSDSDGVRISGSVRSDSGDVTIVGRGGSSPGAFNDGIALFEAAVLESTAGDLTISGIAVADGLNSVGVRAAIDSEIIAGNDLVLFAQGSENGFGTENYGFLSEGFVSADFGDVTIDAVAGSGSIGLFQVPGGAINIFDASGTITIQADTVDLSEVGGPGNLIIQPLTPEQDLTIEDGFVDDGTLSISAGALLDGFQSIQLGDSANGSGLVAIQFATFADPVSIFGGSILVESLDNGVDDVTLVAASGEINSVTAASNVIGGVVQLQGNVAPGQSPGVLVIEGDLELADNDTVTIEIGGTTPGDLDGNHDQLSVSGSVTIGANVDLVLSSFNGFEPAPGDSFVIINQTGGGAVNGTFAGLAEGSTIASLFGSGLTATLSYVGGDGNDVVLIVEDDFAGEGQAIENTQPFATTNYAIALAGTFPSQSGGTVPTQAFSTGSANPILGEIIAFAGNFVPDGYAPADGRLLDIASNSALFSLLGTTFGGDGQNDFALPDLRGRAPIMVGMGTGLSPVTWGQASGSDTISLTESQMASHSHSIANGTQQSSRTGGDQPHSNQMPTLGLHSIIDTNGEIRWVGFNFAPSGFGLPQGQVVPISGNEALFAEIGTLYGGDGVTDFALPDLRGRIVVDDGDGVGLTARATGDVFGQEDVTLVSANLPPHTHPILRDGGFDFTGSSGQGDAYTNVQPSIALNQQIVTTGIFPSQSLTVAYDSLLAVIHTFAAPQPVVTNFAATDGTLLDISGNSAMFSLLGTNYGGDGQNDFALPDFRGRVLVGADLTSEVGNAFDGGSETTTLTQSQLPTHSHDTRIRFEDFQRIEPLGSLIHDPPITGTISSPGGIDTHSVSVDPGQTITVTLATAPSLQGELRLRDPGGAVIASSIASASGGVVVIQTVASGAGGTFQVDVVGANSTTGAYTAEVILNAAVENESFGGSANDNIASAQDLSASFIDLAGGLAQRGAVMGTAQSGTDDFYRISVGAGEEITLAVTGDVMLDLVDSTGTLIAKGVSAENLNQVIHRYVSSSAVDLYAVIGADSDDVDYSLVIVRDGDFDTEINDDPSDVQVIGQAGGVLGFVETTGFIGTPGTVDRDTYEFSVVANDVITVTTFTPADGASDPVNELDPTIEVLDPNGATVAVDDNGAGDGRNATVSFTAAQTGDYRVVVSAAAMVGEYFVSITGATGADPAPVVIASQPEDGASLASFPTTLTIDFSESIDVTSLAAGDLVVGGLAATGVSQIDGDTFVFNLDPNADIGDGVYDVVLAASAVMDLQGVGNELYSGKFSLDTSPPNVTSTLFNGAAFPADRLFDPGPLTILLGFNEPLPFSAAAGMSVQNLSTGEVFVPTYSFNDTTNEASLGFASLPEGAYTLTLESGDGLVEDFAGIDLDGEPLGAGLDRTPSGDGQPGGNYTLDFIVDAASPTVVELARWEPLGSLISQGSVGDGGLHSATDTDAYDVMMAGGQTLAAIVVPTDPTAALSITLGSTTITAAAGQAAVLPPQMIAATGTQTLSVDGDGPTGYRLDIVLNAELETAVGAGDSADASELSLADSFLNLGSGRYAVVGNIDAKNVLTNGGFETGDFSGWTVETTGSPTIDWTVSGFGDGNPGFGFEVTDPPEGDFVAWNSFDGSGPMEFRMYQDVKVPAGGQLSWQYRGQWDFTVDGRSALARTAIVEVVDPANGNVLATLDTFDTGPESTNPTGNTGWQTVVADVSAFAGQTVRMMFREVVPENGTGPGQFEWDSIELISQSSDPIDEFTVALLAGQTIDVLLAGQGNADFSTDTLELLDVDGTSVLGTAVTNPLGVAAENYDLGLLGFDVPADGLYTVQLSSAAGGAYGLIVSESLVFDSEPNDLAGSDPLRDLTVTQSAIGFLSDEQRYFHADFSDGGNPSDDGFTIEAGAGNLWHLSQGRGADPGHSGPDSFYFGEDETATGGGDYDNGARAVGSITSPTIDLSAAPSAELVFQYFLDSEIGFDRASVLVSTDGFASSTTLISELTQSAGQFRTETVDLSAFVGGNIQVRFQFDTGDATANGFEGWYLDDVLVRNQSEVLDDQDHYTLDLTTDDEVLVNVQALFSDVGVSPGNDLMPIFRVIDPDGITEVATNAGAPGGLFSDIRFTAPSTGTYTIELSADSGLGEYLLSTDVLVFEAVIDETDGNTMVVEGGATDTYTIALATAPSVDVDVVVTPDSQIDLGAGAGNPITLTFTPSDALVAQTVTVTAVDDSDIETSPHSGVITHAFSTTDPDYSSASIADLTVSITDNELLTPLISSTANDPTTLAVIPIGVAFGGPVTGFDVSDLSISGGTVGGFSDDGAGMFSFEITTTADGTVTVDIAAGAATDSGNNATLEASQFTIVRDQMAPTPVITGPVGTTTMDPFTVVIDFGETVTGFDTSDLTVVGATVTSLVDDGNGAYTATVNASGDGTVTIDIAAGAANDLAGNSSAAAAQYSVVVDATAPTPVFVGPDMFTADDPFVVRVAFGETVNLFEISDLIVSGGSVISLIDEGNGLYTVTVDASADGLVTIDINADAAFDLGGNGNLAATQFSVTVDTMAPTPVISGPTGPTNSDPFMVTIDFGETVSDFVLADITVGGGTVTALNDDGNGQYTATIDASADGVVTVDVAANVAIDQAGNGNLAAAQFSLTVDTQSPTPVITGPSDPTASDPFSVTIDFGQAVVDFVAGDLTVGGGSVTGLANDGNGSFTATIDAGSDGIVTVDVAADVATDLAGNANLVATQFSVTVDTSAPTPVITGPVGPTNSDPFTVSIDFGEPVVDFVGSDVTVTGGTVTLLSDDGNGVFTATIDPAVDGSILIDIAAGVATDIAGNGNLVATQASVTFDTTSPMPVISGPVGVTALNPFSVSIDFGEPVAVFVLGDITVSGGTATALSDDGGGVFTATITVPSDGPVTVDVLADAATDFAGNSSLAATQYSVMVNTSAPMPVITGPLMGTSDDPFFVSIDFGETMNGFISDDVTVVGGVVTGFTDDGNGAYTVQIDATGDGEVTVDVLPNVATNTGGTGNASATQYSVIVDTVAPTPVISGPSSPANSDPFDVLIRFGESVNDFVMGDITVTGGSVSSLVDDGNGDFTATIAATADGTVTVGVAAGVATDVAGTSNLAATDFVVVVDTTAPALGVPADATFEGNTTGGSLSTSGTLASYLAVATATDNIDPAPVLTNNAPLTVPLGTTDVVFTATDAAGNVAMATVRVTVVDTTAPSLTIPFDISVFGNVAGGAEITLSEVATFLAGASATDIVDSNPSVVNDNAVTVLPFGDNDIEFTATDASGNSVSRAATITVVQPPVLDFGDAPSADQSGFSSSYPVTLADNGARHVVGTLLLGAVTDAESDGQPSAAADADGADEDGVFPIASLVSSAGVSNTASVAIRASQSGSLDAWVDFNRDGDWDDAGEQIASSTLVNAGLTMLSFAVPAGAAIGETAARFRISSAGGLAPTGEAADGEVEDYLYSIVDASASPSVAVRLANPNVSMTLESDALVIRSGQTVLFQAPLADVGDLSLTGTPNNDAILINLLTNLIPGGGFELVSGGGVDTLALEGDGGALDLTDPIIHVRGIPNLDLTSADANTVTVNAASIAVASPVSRQISIDAGQGDQVILLNPEDWRLTSTRIDASTFYVTADNSGSGGSESIEMTGPQPWHNFLQAGDVNNDGVVTAGDALRIINELSRRAFSDRDTEELRSPLDVAMWPDAYFDQNADGRASALDALRVINQLARQGNGSGEGEQVFSGALTKDATDEENTTEPVESLVFGPLPSKLLPQIQSDDAEQVIDSIAADIAIGFEAAGQSDPVDDLFSDHCFVELPF